MFVNSIPPRYEILSADAIAVLDCGGVGSSGG